MERLSPASPGAAGQWQVATVLSVQRETLTVKSFRLAVPGWTPHLPGQHYDVRLTAPDGYQAQRSYSVASSPLDVDEVQLTINRLADGEVSPYFHDVVEPGDQVEVRGPFASYFVWRGTEPGPVLLVGGGSGVVPLMAMLRHRRRATTDVDMRLVYSVRGPEELIYARELGRETTVAYSRAAPRGWAGHRGRIDASLLGRAAAGAMTAYVCGSNGFVETISSLLVDAGPEPDWNRTERFGRSGGGSS